ncbi:unnamed protein product [Arctia plantaginis]|uniref:Band 7 domain-containing protein n=1 Tax=Arctia plantaginis TaxID=874455 RepID=A0A8S1A9P6_ARCPL|nr:unnamed protein product [Arctia plantaginis]CAB3243211.1 unnamed protein product [Arctia plantaginis]
MSEKLERVMISEPEDLSSTSSSAKSTIAENIFIVLSILGVIICPLLLIVCFRVVKQYKRAVVLRFGKVRADSPAGPGVIWVLPFTDEVTIIDLRTQSFNLPPQQILTKDSVTVTVDAVGYFHVMEPLQCLLNVQYYRRSTELITIAVLRNVLGQYTLADALTSRQSMSTRTKFEIDAIISDWGIHIERVEIKNILLPFDLQEAMAVEAEATRIAKAKLIEAAGEIQAAVNLREASRIIMENPQIMLLRYLQSLNSIASRQKTSIIFPFPIQIPEPLGQDQFPNTVHQNTNELLNQLKNDLQADKFPENLLQAVPDERGEVAV